MRACRRAGDVHARARGGDSDAPAPPPRLLEQVRARMHRLGLVRRTERTYIQWIRASSSQTARDTRASWARWRSSAFSQRSRSTGRSRRPRRTSALGTTVPIPRGDPNPCLAVPRLAGMPARHPKGLPVRRSSPMYMHAVATTAVELLGARVVLLPQQRRPSPLSGRVSFCIILFEACSAFTARYALHAVGARSRHQGGESRAIGHCHHVGEKLLRVRTREDGAQVEHEDTLKRSRHGPRTSTVVRKRSVAGYRTTTTSGCAD